MEVLVSWREVAERDRNGVITMYQVLLEPAGEVGASPMSANSTQLSVVVTGLEGHVLYATSVRAFTVVGGGPYSTPPVPVMTFQGSKFPILKLAQSKFPVMPSC